MDNLYLRLGQDEAAPVRWCTSDAPANVRNGTLAEAAAALGERRLLVLVPAATITLATAHVPTRNRQRLRQALPFALEEQLASEVEQLHFALPDKLEGDEAVAAIIDRQRLRAWLAALAAAELKPAAVIPDLLALPRAPGEWSLLLESDGFLLRCADLRGYAMEPAMLEHLLPLALEQAGDNRPQLLRVHDARPAGGEPIDPARWCGPYGIEVVTATTGDGLALLAAGAGRGHYIDLQQGEFSRREQLGKLWRPWRAAAAVAAVLVLLNGATVGYRYLTLTHEQTRLDEAINDLYRTTFPESTRIVDARLQMEQKLKELRGGSGGQEFERLLAGAAPALKSAGVELNGLQYANGAIDAEVEAAEVQAIDALRAALEQAGLKAELAGADSSGGKVTGHVTIRLGGA